MSELVGANQMAAGPVMAARAAPADPLAQLDARYPVALLPVRLETRFVRALDAATKSVGQLLVRIYPDSIMADSHEPLLTAGEVGAGQDYWRRAFLDGDEQAAWTVLLGLAKAERAAWIVDQTTPTNLDGHTGATVPVFPTLTTRAENWHRAPEARGLPDRWVVSTFRGAQRIHQVTSAPVRDGLALTPRLSGDGDDPADTETVDLSGDGLTVSPDLQWAYDFDTAVAAGMAVRIPLTTADLDQGFSTLLVLGARTGSSADEQAATLADLLIAHRYSRGLAFVAQGTPTNNTADGPSAYPVADPAGATSFPIARGPARAVPGTDGARFAAGLGVPAAVVDHVSGAEGDEQTAAGAMVRALWPATVGYFLDQLLSPELAAATVESIRAFTAGWLRPRGPLPALRVGASPYGILPVAAWSSWAARPGESVPAGLESLLTRLAGVAAGHTAAASRVGASGDPDADLVGVLGMDASARSARIRRGFGNDTTWNMFSYTGRDLAGLQAAQQQVGLAVLTAIGETGRDPRALHLSYLTGAYDFGGPLVAAPPLSETQPLTFDYIAWLARATPAALRSQTAPPVPVGALLYLMLRHGLLTEYDEAARGLLATSGLLQVGEAREAELVGILPQRVQGRASVPASRTAWERFDLTIAATGGRTVGEFLANPAASAGAAHLADFRDALTGLIGRPSAELDRLFSETLDACSHRVDAWITALATQRLAALRAPAGPDSAAGGIYLGCYGWVIDLHADPAGATIAVTAPDGSTVDARTDSDGYLYAPSMLHAATAAVLRSGYLAHADQAQRPYAVDLSSARVRAALDVLDAVRDTQPLGAVLGYAFERGLHDNHPDVELDRFIGEFRRLYPAVANKAAASGAPADAVAARNVVDGLALLHASQNGAIPWGTGIDATPGERTAIETELAALDDSVDAVSDLLLSESVFQVLKGSPSAAAATLDTLARGQRPPEPEVVATPRGGTVVHQRVALLFGDGTPSAGWATIPATPRSAAAPELDAWLGGLIGPPTGIAATVTRTGSPAVQVTVAQLGLHPVDLLAIVAAAAATGTPDELDRRIRRVVSGTDPVSTDPVSNGPVSNGPVSNAPVSTDPVSNGPVSIDYTDAGPAAVSLAVAAELLAAAARTIGQGRALRAGDLLPPTSDINPATPSPVLVARATAARQELGDIRNALAAAGTDPAALRTALDRAAAFDLPEALAATDGTSITAILDARLAAADPTDPTAALTTLFGTGLPIIGPFPAEQPGLLTPALAAEPGLGDDPDGTVEGWLAQVARVQPAVDAWRDVQLYGRALGRDLARPRIVQLPAEATPAAWAGLGFATESDRPRSGLVSVALLGAPPPAAGAPWCGLLLADWPEIIPAVDEDAGLAVQFDAPGAQAPQAVLIAVPPDARSHWSYAALESTLLDTLRLAAIRALDLSQLGAYGQLIPMTFLAENTAGAAISTSFAGLLVADATIGATQ